MPSFGEKLRETKKALKPSSVETYIRNVRRLRRAKGELPVPPSDHKWLLAKPLLKWFDEQNLSVRRHLATAATVALKVYQKTSDEWKKRQHESMKEFDEQRRKRQLSDRQKKKLPAKGFDSLKKVIQNLKRELSHILRKPPLEWTFSELQRVQNLLIISLYYDRPLRLDYAGLKVGSSESGNFLAKSMSRPRGWHITLREYKTKDSYGTRKFKPNRTNQLLLNKFIPASNNLTEHGFLLSNRSKVRMTKQVLSKRLMKITRKYVGKSFSTQLLRILFAMKHRGVLESAKQVSEKLMHSQEQSLLYAKKKP
jgi:hypothetical protein